MSKLNRKGRNKWEAKHVRLYDYMLSSKAYLSLTCPARAVLIELARVYDGANNGRLGLSVRTAAQRSRIAQGTARRAFRELMDCGFVECVKAGAFSYKARHASEWRLTWWPCDVTGALPSKEFMRWQPEMQNPVSNYNATVPSFDTATEIANVHGR
jgi:DNA-binding transcriptional regulator YhcF (GntR family)